MRRSAIALLTLLSLSAAAQAADLPVVKAATPPPPPPGPKFFAWVEGGWSSFDIARVHAVDASSSGLVLPEPLFFDISDGRYVRGEAGAIFSQRVGLVDAFSVFASYRSGSEDLRGNPPITNLDFFAPGISIGEGGSLPGGFRAEQAFDLLDIQLRFKHVPSAWPGVTIAAEPFFALTNHNVSAVIPIAARYATLDSNIFGFQAAVETRSAVTPALTFRTRASIGAYHFSADADFSMLDDEDAITRYNTSKDATGFRAGAEIGLDFALTPGVMLGVTAGVDYWSKLPTPILSYGNPPIAPQLGINSTRFTDYFVGARLTFATGNP